MTSVKIRKTNTHKELWSYVERKTTKLSFWAIFVFGELFLIGILVFIFNPNSENISPLAIPIALVALLLWTGIFKYFLSNFPKSVSVSNEGLLVTYSEKRKQLFSWEDVFIKKPGNNPIPLIFIKKKKGSALITLPNIIFLDGSSKGYKELINRIRTKVV